MTKITYTRYPTASLTVDGHCEAERTNGNDLCCAAVSMLVCTFLQRLEETKLKCKSVYVSDGYARGEFSVQGKNGFRALETLDTVLAGFRLLKEQYPENITIYGGKK